MLTRGLVEAGYLLSGLMANVSDCDVRRTTDYGVVLGKFIETTEEARGSISNKHPFLHPRLH